MIKKKVREKKFASSIILNEIKATTRVDLINIFMRDITRIVGHLSVKMSLPPWVRSLKTGREGERKKNRNFSSLSLILTRMDHGHAIFVNHDVLIPSEDWCDFFGPDWFEIRVSLGRETHVFKKYAYIYDNLQGDEEPIAIYSAYMYIQRVRFLFLRKKEMRLNVKTTGNHHHSVIFRNETIICFHNFFFLPLEIKRFCGSLIDTRNGQFSSCL